MKSIYKPQLQIARPAWSPDGKHIAFIEGLMSDEPSVGGDIFLIPSAGGNANNITPGENRPQAGSTWTSDNKILFAEILDADSSVSLVDPLNPAVSNLWRGAESITAGLWNPNLSVSADGTQSAVIRSSFSAPPEVWAGAIGQWKQITSRNKDLKPGWGDAKSIQWTNDKFDIQGWLIAPKDFDPSKKYPLIVGVHGGPGAAEQSAWPDDSSFLMALPAAGYFLLLPNPRGSFGQGEEFTQGQRKRFRLRRFCRHHGRRRRRAKTCADRSRSSRSHRLELRRLHDDVGRDADESIQSRDGRSGDRESHELLRRK